jgi:hypothetical protein
MKADVSDGHSGINTIYVHYNDSNGYNPLYTGGLEMDLLRIVLEQKNMMFEHVLTPERL